jgi:malonyl-CoA O-methyltransferase
MNIGYSIDKNRVRQAFSRQAPVYDENAHLQKDVAKKLISMISSLTLRPLPQGEGWGEGRVLDTGIGTGFAAGEFSARFPHAHIFGCDIAWGMLREAGKTSAKLTEADIEHLPYKDNSYELVFSSLALQWTNLASSLSEAYRVLRPKGMLYLATFGDRTLRELSDSYISAWRSIGMEGMTETMSFDSSQKIKKLMESVGFKGVEVKTDLMKIFYRSPEALLRSLKAIGAGNHSRDIPSRGLLNETFRIYNDRYGDGEGIPASFEVVYTWGTKG